jgi:hypothetical protein
MVLTKSQKEELISRLKNAGWTGRKLEAVLPTALALLESGNSVDGVVRLIFEGFGYML